MADVTLTVVALTKAGIPDIATHASAKKGDARSGAGNFIMPNDGRTFLAVVAGVTGPTTIDFDATVKDKYGRTETLKVAVAASKTALMGPFLPEIWNTGNNILFKNAVENATDFLLAVRIANPT